LRDGAKPAIEAHWSRERQVSGLEAAGKQKRNESIPRLGASDQKIRHELKEKTEE
jgi:hypothetical protein